jgi:hypothetical protein
VNVLPVSTSVVEKLPTAVPLVEFSATLAADNVMLVGASLTSVTVSVNPTVTGVLPESDGSSTLTVTA